MLSKQVFEVLPISFHTGAQPSMPLVDCLVDDMLLQTRPCSNQALVQISNVEYGRAVDTFLHDFPDFIVHWIQIGLFCGQCVAWARPEVPRCHEYQPVGLG